MTSPSEQKHIVWTFPCFLLLSVRLWIAGLVWHMLWGGMGSFQVQFHPWAHKEQHFTNKIYFCLGGILPSQASVTQNIPKKGCFRHYCFSQSTLWWVPCLGVIEFPFRLMKWIWFHIDCIYSIILGYVAERDSTNITVTWNWSIFLSNTGFSTSE